MDGWRERARRVIFEADTPGGKAFDVALLVAIGASVLLVMFESVEGISRRQRELLVAGEWIITGLFTVEYVARLVTVERPSRYARSFFGIVDLLAILPAYVSLLIPGARPLMVVRSLRLLRVFRVFKMARWLEEANYLLDAVRDSSRKVLVFLATVLLVTVVIGSTMYVIEGPERGFDNMFIGVYWAIVTMSTVGFGDIAPVTPLGRTLASGLMILGYSVIAVPTGIVSSDIARRQALATVHSQAGAAADQPPPQRCPACGAGGHQPDALHCRHCAARLDVGAGGPVSG